MAKKKKKSGQIAGQLPGALPSKDAIMTDVVKSLLERKRAYETAFAASKGRAVDPQTQYAYNSVLKTLIVILKIWQPETDADKDIATSALAILQNDYFGLSS